MVDRRCDIAIIGGGIVGLAAAMELLSRRPSLRLLILEKEDGIARHQTGHNSGVIHSGIYYAPGSMKARLCVAGKARLLRFCDEHGIPYDLCGKVIVVTDEEELPRLKNLYRRGQENGVPGLEMIGPERLRELEPYCAGIRALWSPTTGIVDYTQVTEVYADEVGEKGGEILTGHEVVGMEQLDGRYQLETTSGTVEARYVVSCAGLQADRVASMSGAPAVPKIVPFRGDYYVLRPERSELVRGMIYPVPDPRFPFLGVHFTRRMNGEIWLGPNAVLAFAREGYGRMDISARDLLETLTFRGFGMLAWKFWQTGFEEMYRDFSKAAFLAALRRYMPALRSEDIVFGPSGVRAQALGLDGSLVDDFVVNHKGHALHVRNAPSPAATSSLAIGELIADTTEAAFGLE
ncbi:MAG: L-2-hydroxyglutarate oxidase [Chloroflexota bacterium]|nr:L-2-hydroxyglutarate oxidase [Chloroflexota bacterium]